MIRDLFSMTDRRSQRILSGLIALSVCAALCQGIAFVALFPFLTDLFAGDSMGGSFRVILVAVVLNVVFTLAAGTIGRASSAAVLSSLLQTLGNRVGSLPLGYFTGSTAGRFAEMAASGIGFAASVPHTVIRPVIQAVVTPAVITVAVLFTDWRVGLVLVAAIPVIWWAYRGIGQATGSSDLEHSHTVSVVTERLIEFTRCQPAIRSAGQECVADFMVDDAVRAQHDAFARATVTEGAAMGRLGNIVHIAMVVAVIVTVAVALSGDLTAAELVALLIVVTRFTEPIVNAGALSGGFSSGRNTLAELKALQDIPTLPEPTVPAEPADHSVEFRDVTFSYRTGTDDSAVLHRVSFIVPHHSLVAVVGPSGCGKTTVMKLISRFYDPQSGTVLIGGVPLPDLGTSTVNEMVTPVFQDTFLFDTTVRENILVGDPAADDGRFSKVAHQAAVDRVVELLPQGWESRVGEGGTALSGGERQRVSIARALLKDSPVVLLDEPTSSLDAGTERAISDTMEALRSDHTVIVVAHRLRSVQHADMIVVLGADGSVAETGTHEELFRRGGLYRRLWDKGTGGAEGQDTDFPVTP